LNLKTSRPDGRLVKNLHPYRRIMQFIMPGRNESLVYFDTYVDPTPLLSYLEQARKRFDVDMTHCTVAACLRMLRLNPTINRFTIGGRLYERRGEYVTFSMKRKALDRAAKLATVKMQFVSGETFRSFCERVAASIGTERSGERTYADKEFDVFEAMPRPVLKGGVTLMRWLDYYNLLPGSFIENDPLYTGMFVANLGSLGMDPGYHHLYEYGTCPAFAMVGQLADTPTVVDGKVEVRRTLHIRFTYDERVDDGLNARYAIDSIKIALEHPYDVFGCLKEDGSDARALDAPFEEPSVSEVSARAASGR
jgi:hypothetical protein